MKCRRRSRMERPSGRTRAWRTRRQRGGAIRTRARCVKRSCPHRVRCSPRSTAQPPLGRRRWGQQPKGLEGSRPAVDRTGTGPSTAGASTTVQKAWRGVAPPSTGQALGRRRQGFRFSTPPTPQSNGLDVAGRKGRRHIQRQTVWTWLGGRHAPRWKVSKQFLAPIARARCLARVPCV